MFKGLREKISLSDNNQKNKQSSNSNLDKNEDGSNTSGEHNLSRFSSISSLVSDVGSVFSKPFTTSHLVQPISKNSKLFYDSESVSEYDDSIAQGDTMNKEELFKRFQRAQSLAKRYKTRSLEVVECYKKLEFENTKLTQTLTESQDFNIRRISELKEQIELDKQAKNDVEENYKLMIDENTELINVLRLQISLLKEGKDLPIELESQIREKHEIEIEKQKKKDEEIKELRATITQREKLLQRCKEKIISLNSQLTEIKMKSENVTDTSLTSDFLNEKITQASDKPNFYDVAILENTEKEHSERIKNLLCDFDKKKMEIESDFEKKLTELKQELNDMKDKMSRVSQDNERLEEQVNIRTKIIEDFMKSQDNEEIEKQSVNFMEQLNCSDVSLTYSSDNINTNLDAEMEDLKNEIKFLLGRIDQMEALKSQTEEETLKIEEELKGAELILRKEREENEDKSRFYESKLEEIRMELNCSNSKTEEMTIEINNLKNVKSKKNDEIEDILHNHQQLELKYQNIEVEFKKLKEEMLALTLRFDKTLKINEELEIQIQSISKDYNNDKVKVLEHGEMCKNIQDKCDELNSLLEKEIREKNQLKSLLNEIENHKVSTLMDQENLELKMVEMRQRYDHQIEESSDQLNCIELVVCEKDLKIQELESKISSLNQEMETAKKEFRDADAKNEMTLNLNKGLEEELNEYKNKLNSAGIDRDILLKDLDENIKLLKEKESLFIKTGLEKEDLDLKLQAQIEKYEVLKYERDDALKELENLKVELNQQKLKCLEYFHANENLQKEFFSKDGELQILMGEKVSITKSLLEIETLKNNSTEENRDLKIKHDQLIKDIQEMETLKKEFKDISERNEEILNVNNKLNLQLEEYKNKRELVDKENNLLFKEHEKCLKLLKEKEEFIENIEIKSNAQMTENEKLKYDLENLFRESNNMKVELDKQVLKCLEFVSEKEKLQYDSSSKDDELRLLIEEKIAITNELSRIDIIKNKVIEENKELKTKLEELLKEIDIVKEKLEVMKQWEINFGLLNDEFTKYKQDNDILKKEMYDQYVSLQKERENIEKTNEDNILHLQKSLQSKDEENKLEETINIFRKYFNIFGKWIEDMIISDSSDDYYIKSSTCIKFWDQVLEEGCAGIKDISLLGRSIERILLSWHVIHNELCQLKNEMNKSKDDSKYENLLKCILDFCSAFDCDSKEIKTNDILHRLSDIREDLEKKNKQFSDLEDSCKSIEKLFIPEEIINDDTWNQLSISERLRKDVMDNISSFKNKFREQENETNKLRSENELFLKKFEKMSSDRVQHFKVLSTIFEITDVDFEQRSFSKVIMKRLKDYTKKLSHLTMELNETHDKLKEVEGQLKVSIEDCKLKQLELDELNESASGDRSRLLTIRQELDISLSRLNEFSDEKGRIDEEKQSMKKELHELNNKIKELKLDFEKQNDVKQKLEKHFDESLEKVKINHLALEETYKNEIEKLHGYQNYLEGQITANKEETTRKLTDNAHVSNLKLEEVLQQSEQLLVLNNQYKKLLDQLKIESDKVKACMNGLEEKCENQSIELEKMKIENEKLIKNSKEFQEAYELTILERNKFKLELSSLINEKEKSVEEVVNLRSSNESIEIEKFKYSEHIKELEEKNRISKEDISLIKESLVKIQNECDCLKKEKNVLINQLKDEHDSTNELKCELVKKNGTIETYKLNIDQFNTKLKDMKDNHEKEIFELKQEFSEDKSNTEDDHNHRVKKLAKDFNDKMLEKEHEFQNTFHEALGNIRKEEARQKLDLKNEIDELNKIIIELETEKNSLLNTISDCEKDLKKAKSTLQSNEFQMQALNDQICGYKSEISELERQILKMNTVIQDVEQRSKINQTVDTRSYYEEQSNDTVNVNDHEVLQMHCADVEEQVRQLHLENISLKKTIAANQVLSSSSPAHEHIISAMKSHQLAYQPSFDNVSIKSSNILNATSFRSPNTSCSEYQFCPYPITEATEYEYLRDILIKYMTGLETTTLARVLCTVMKFSNDETNRVIRFEQDKKKVLQIFPR